MPVELLSPKTNAFRTRPRKMLSIPAMPNTSRPPLVRRPFGPRSEKARPTITLTVATLVVVLPIAMLAFLSSTVRTPVHLTQPSDHSSADKTAPTSNNNWAQSSNVIHHSSSSQLAAEGIDRNAAHQQQQSQQPQQQQPPIAQPPAPRPVDRAADDPGRPPDVVPPVAPAPPQQPVAQRPDQPQQPPPVGSAPDALRSGEQRQAQPPQQQQQQQQQNPALSQQRIIPPGATSGSSSSSSSNVGMRSAGGGVPPPQLPDGHANKQMLETIRARTQMRPRWPDSANMDVRKLRSYGPGYSSILVSYKLKLIYVPVFKVGTSSMMWHIAYLENNQHVVPHRGKVTPGHLQYLLHEMDSPAWRGRALCHMKPDKVRVLMKDPSFLKFGFVRNPYDRTVSAYLDKVMSMPKSSWEYQEQMYGMYGDDPVKRAAVNVTRPTFPEFLTAIHAVIKSPRAKSADLNSPDGYETNKSRRDLHWRPQVELLHPDLVHLDFVGKFENLEEDRQVVLDWMYQFTDRRMPKRGQRIHSTNPADKVAIFKQLRENKNLRDLLLDAYKKDFDRFDFSREVPDVNTKL